MNKMSVVLDPNSNDLPKRSQLPEIPGNPKGSAWLWGKDDEVGLPLNTSLPMDMTDIRDFSSLAV